MKKKRIIIVFAITLVSLLLPSAVFAGNTQDPGADWNIKVEYRYTAGQESKLKIPDSITRFDRNYHLIDKQPPVLESTLPAERVYTWHLDGVLTEKEKKQFEDIEGVVLTPVEIAVQQPADITETLSDLPSNDIEALPQSKEGWERAAVRFEVQEEDEWDLPKYYTAEVVYRGLKTVMEAGYYKVNSKYSTTEELDDVDCYVVVATYAPDQTPQAVTSVSTGGTSGGEGEPVVASSDGQDGTMIADQESPLSSTPKNNPGNAGSEAAKLPTALPFILAGIFAGLCALLLFKEHQRRKEKKHRRMRKKAVMT